MVQLDREQSHPGYWSSPWPVECGGNRRQKARAGRLDAGRGTARATFRENGRWNVMVVERDPGEWYATGTLPAFTGPAPYGWVERFDPETLEPLAIADELPCGDHVWCGALLAHANGSLYCVNGSFLHRLSPDCEVIAEQRLPVDRSHNGLLALSDGTLITKDLRLEGQGGTTVSRIDPETLALVEEPLILPEASMGRIAAEPTDGGDQVYIPGTEHMWRVEVRDRMQLDDHWKPRYRDARGDHGLAWDSCLSGGNAWLMDCGDIESVRAIHETVPNGRFDAPPGRQLSWRLPAPWSGAQRLIRVDCETGEVESLTPFGTPRGGIIAPPVAIPERDRVVCWDSLGGGMAGIDTSDGGLEVAWTLEVRPTMQPVVFPESGELVINDFRDVGSDDLVVVDVDTGALIDRVATGSRIANGMFLTPGGERDVFYCSVLGMARVHWS